MKYILIAVFHVNSGSTGMSVEFDSLQACNYAKQFLYAERERASIRLETAFCVSKGK